MRLQLTSPIGDCYAVELSAVCYGSHYTFRKLDSEGNPISEPGCIATPPDGEAVSEANALAHIEAFLLANA
jgi:hypothetical protein